MIKSAKLEHLIHWRQTMKGLGYKLKVEGFLHSIYRDFIPVIRDGKSVGYNPPLNYKSSRALEVFQFSTFRFCWTKVESLIKKM